MICLVNVLICLLNSCRALLELQNVGQQIY